LPNLLKPVTIRRIQIYDRGLQYGALDDRLRTAKAVEP